MSEHRQKRNILIYEKYYTYYTITKKSEYLFCHQIHRPDVQSMQESRVHIFPCKLIQENVFLNLPLVISMYPCNYSWLGEVKTIRPQTHLDLPKLSWPKYLVRTRNLTTQILNYLLEDR